VAPPRHERRGVWVEGAELCAVSDGVTERRYLGAPAPAPAGAAPGAVWVEDGEQLHYVDERGQERRVPAASWAEDFARPHWLRVAPAEAAAALAGLREEFGRLAARAEEG
jgi:hypothetical protein